MNKRIVALLSALILTLSVTSCGDISEPINSDGNTVQSSEISEGKKETAESILDMPKIEPVPIPDGGWTEETISEVIYVNGYNIKLPCDFEELSNKINILIDEDHLYFFPNGQGASTEIEYNGNEVGSVIIDDFSDKENFNFGKIYSIICNSDYNELGENNSVPININGIELGSTAKDVENNLSFDKNENDFGDECIYSKKIGHYSIKINCKKNIVWHISIVYVKG